MSGPLSLNLRTSDAQGGLLEGFEGQAMPAASKETRPRLPAPVGFYEDRPTATNCVPVEVIFEDIQQDLFK